jgi:hypothetical protein
MIRASDLRGASRLAIDATLGLTNLVEAVHHTVVEAPHPLRTFAPQPTKGVTGLVYRTVRGVTRIVGGSLDALLRALDALLEPATASSAEREAVLAALNGILGDHLVANGNPLAIPMQWRQRGVALELTPSALAAALPDPTGRIMIFVHGLCMNDLQWRRNGHDRSAALAAACGFTPVYLHYNSGLHVSTNGRAFAELAEALVHAWPVPVAELAIVAHSMGGLVARSGCAAGTDAGHAWRARLTKMFFLGTPHHGAPLERGGHWVDVILGGSPYTAAFARLGKIRSAGITDLRHGNLSDDDWQHHDRFAHRHPLPQPLALPDDVRCHALAASIAGRAQAGPRKTLPGDGLVPVDSALGHHADRARHLHLPAAHTWIGYDMHHMDFLDRLAVYRRIERWLAQ